ncbi:hypothetical protein BT69DRAFT_1343877 [Atractiella rhizophila]|nr:hypothetical protein BT69DRAFT_1343877 [Atractiella rhizophila]
MSSPPAPELNIIPPQTPVAPPHSLDFPHPSQYQNTHPAYNDAISQLSRNLSVTSVSSTSSRVSQHSITSGGGGNGGKERKRRSFNPFHREKEDESLISVIDGGLHSSEYLPNSNGTPEKNRSRSASRVSLVPPNLRPEDLDADRSTPESRTLAILTADTILQPVDHDTLSPTSDLGSPTSVSSKRRSRLSAFFTRGHAKSDSSSSAADFSSPPPPLNVTRSRSSSRVDPHVPIQLSALELALFPDRAEKDGGPITNEKLASLPLQDVLHLAVQLHTLSKASTVVKKKHHIRRDEFGTVEDDPRLILSTKMFIQLAERGSKGGEILAGLALRFVPPSYLSSTIIVQEVQLMMFSPSPHRHGWGIQPNEAQGLHYLRSAASEAIVDLQQSLHSTSTNPNSSSNNNSNDEERAYLRFAIYEVANSFLFGLGVEKNERKGSRVPRDGSRPRGPGGKRDKFKAATWYRKAEKSGGTPIVGNSWIWKDKYGPADE